MENYALVDFGLSTTEFVHKFPYQEFVPQTHDPLGLVWSAHVEFFLEHIVTRIALDFVFFDTGGIINV